MNEVCSSHYPPPQRFFMNLYTHAVSLSPLCALAAGVLGASNILRSLSLPNLLVFLNPIPTLHGGAYDLRGTFL
jgi:hypothetical protein